MGEDLFIYLFFFFVQAFQESIFFFQTPEVIHLDAKPPFEMTASALSGPLLCLQFLPSLCSDPRKTHTHTTGQQFGGTQTRKVCVLFQRIYLQHYVCVLSFLNVKAFSGSNQQNSFRLRLISKSQTPLSAASSLFNAGRPFFPVSTSEVTVQSVLMATTAYRHGNGPITAAGARQVPEENLCFGSRSNAAAILLKRKKKKKIAKKKIPKKYSRT